MGSVIARRILWPTDYFEVDLRSLHVAVDVARASGGELVLMHVVGDTAEEVYGEKTKEGKDRAAWALWKFAQGENEKRLVALAQSELSGFQNVRALVSFGDPATRILEAVREEGIDLIVLAARREKSLLQEMLLGGVAYKIVRTAPCSVLVVK